MHYPLSTICSTRFNSKTWNENVTWKTRNDFKGGIYNSPKTLNSAILQDSLVFILEMNNDENKLMGIGLIKNMIHVDKYYRVYDDNNYNRYTYKTTCRIDCEEFEKDEIMYVQIMETLLFKGSAHSKRGYGITLLPTRIIKNKVFDFNKFFMDMFNRRFSQDETKINMANVSIQSYNDVKNDEKNDENTDEISNENNVRMQCNCEEISLSIMPRRVRGKTKNINKKNKLKTCNAA
jgi:hypothetical protein